MKVKAFLLATMSFINAYAQKLPNVQQASLQAPANVKIDGNTAEWGNTFQAYNRSTELFYSIANNNRDLFLVVYADSYDVMKRIMMGGITFTIKKDNKECSFTFPAYDAESTNALDFKLRSVKDKPADEAKAIVRQNNLIQKGKHRLIAIKGIGGTDSLVSIYNVSGIRAAGLFDDKNTYTLEMAIDLKMIGLSLKDTKAFAYQISVNGWKFSPATLIQSTIITPEQFEEGNKRAAQRAAATYFKGEYMLAN